MESSDTDTLCYLSLQEQMNIIFFIVHFRTNCRVGGLLNLKMKDVREARPNKTHAKHRDIFRQKYNASARVRTHDLVSARQTHYQLRHGD